ncbi:hypothetical protein Fmac_015334 [Flemingia macrophylla]|uniref:Uncharacterized protein n=1 Tax=Flemingia macrophylla TaxID=520843 RepID=A0ABD1ME98_9FABA
MMPLSLEEFMHDVATATSAKTRKLEGKLDALVNLVTQLAANQKPSSVARISNDHHTSFYLSSHARNDAIVIRGVHDVAIATSAKTRKLEGKLDALVNLVIQLAANQKPTSVARVGDIRSSNDHHTSVCPSSQQSGVDEDPEAYATNTYSRPPQSNRDKVLDIEDGSQLLALEGKLDALVNLVTQLDEIRSLPLLQESATSVLPMTTILVSVLLRSNLEWMSILRLMLQTPTADHHSSRDKALDREDGSQLLELEGKLDALVNLVTQLAANQKPSSVARVCGIRPSNEHHTIVFPSSQQSGVDEHPEAYAGTPIADHHNSRDKAFDREDGSQLLALDANQEPASIARVCGIRSSNDHHISVCPSSQNLEWMSILRLMLQTPFSARNDAIIIRGVLDVATDTSAETRRLEGMLDALVNLVTQLAANQKPASIIRVCGIRSSNGHHTSLRIRRLASVARVCGIRSSNSHHTSVYHSSQQSKLSARNDAFVIRGVHDVATDTSAKTRKLEGKLNALVNLLTQLAMNQKPASVARVCNIHSSKDHHTSVCPSLHQSGMDEHPEAYAANTYSRPPDQQRRGI